MAGSDRHRLIIAVVVVGAAALLLVIAVLTNAGGPQASNAEPQASKTEENTHEETAPKVNSLTNSAAATIPDPAADLRHAIMTASPAGIEAAISAGADVNASFGGPDSVHADWSPLHVAAETQGYPIVMALLASGASADATTPDGRTPLMIAAAARDPSALRAVLEAGANLSATTPNNSTALHFAARSGSATQVAALLEAGAPPNAADADGRTPLMIAAEKGDVDKVIALLNAGANPALTDADGRTAAQLAVSAPNPRGQEIAELLSEAGGG